MTMSMYSFMPKSLKTILLASSCFAVLMAQSPVFAQTDQAADVKRESNSVVDALMAQDIGLFSDNNIGGALARIPGVLLERDAGEGFRISIRGLGPRFVRTTVNGRTYVIELRITSS